MHMPTVSGKELEHQAINSVAQLMLAAARTAPKAGGIDDILTALVWGEDKERLAAEMEKIGEEQGNRDMFLGNAENIRASECVVLIGVRGTKILR